MDGAELPKCFPTPRRLPPDLETALRDGASTSTSNRNSNSNLFY